MERGFKEPLNVRIKNEIEKIKSFPTFKEKTAYIWDYYKLPILVTIFVAACLISIISGIRKNNYNTALNISYINCTTLDNHNETNVLKTLATKWLEVDGVSDRIVVDAGYVIDPNVYSEETYASSLKIAASITAQQMDIFICDELMLDTYYETGYYVDLSAVISEELINSLGDRVIYRTTEDGMVHPYAISIAGLPIYDKLIFSIDKPLITIVSNAPNLDNCAKFIENIITYDGNDDLSVSKQ